MIITQWMQMGPAHLGNADIVSMLHQESHGFWPTALCTSGQMTLRS